MKGGGGKDPSAYDLQNQVMFKMTSQLSKTQELAFHHGQGQALLWFKCEMSLIGFKCLSTGSPEGGAV